MKESILCVDDEPNILQAYQRTLRKEFDIHIASSGLEGLKRLSEQGPYAIIVSDMRMPGMDGIQFLSEVKTLAPSTVRMMLTGNADQQTAIEAVNEGNIFRFLTKPCSPEILAKSLHAGIDQYHLIMAEKELLEKTLQGSVQLMTDVLSLVNPTAFGRAARVRPLVQQIASQLQVKEIWPVEVAAMLSQLGCLTVPEEILAKVFRGSSLTTKESEVFQSHPAIGRDLIVRIPRLEAVAEIIRYQDKQYDGGGVPENGVCGERIPLGARILKVALDIDKLESSGTTKTEACEQIEHKGSWYDPKCVAALKNCLASELKYTVLSTRINDLTVNMRLAEDIVSLRGLLMVAKGQQVTPSMKVRLEHLVKSEAIPETIKVLVAT